jgi:hypothetical protein
LPGAIRTDFPDQEKEKPMFKKALLAAALFAGLCAPASAAVINLGVNPTSATGHFSNDPVNGVFTDQITFQLVGSPLYLSFASATNDFVTATDIISGFTGQLFEQIGAIGGGDDIAVAPAVAAVPCAQNPSGCQILAGFALLDSGNYYLQLSGNAGTTAGYGGNLTTTPLAAAVPEASTWAMMIAGFFGVAGMAYRRRKQQDGATLAA